MSLAEVLSEHKNPILTKWLDLTLQTYPPDTRKFFKSRTNRFANPVGWTFSDGMALIFDALLVGESLDTEDVRSVLDGIIRMRAVQDFTASEEVDFIYILKPVIRETMRKEVHDERVAQDLQAFESRIDRLALLAFDVYMRCREKIFDLRAKELKNRTSRILERACQVWQARGECVAEDLEFEPVNKK